MILIFSMVLVLLVGCGDLQGINRDHNQSSTRVMSAASPQAKAFPGALGFGANATGGRGGKVIHVTNTNDSGPGSLRAAIETDGPRIIVFDVGGLISLRTPLSLEKGDVTIAGQTAPGNGIALRGSRLRVEASNVIIRGVRFRPGDQNFGDTDYQNRDGISVGKGTRLIENVIIDSNSMSWSVDELASVWGNVRNLTYSNNLIAEALNNSKHPKGAHSMAMVIGAKEGDPGPQRITLARNLYANARFRCPLVKETQAFEMINNYCYGFFHNVETGSNLQAHFIKNFLHLTKNARDRQPMQLSGGSNSYYLKGNLDTIYRTSNSQPETDIMGGSSSSVRSAPLFSTSGTPEIAVSQLQAHVFANAGARWPERDNTDKRIINDVKNDVARFIDSPSDVGGYDSYPQGTAEKDSDRDGMPDSFEVAYGTDPNKYDAAGDRDGNGYSNIEEYINSLIDKDSVQFPVASEPDRPSNDESDSNDSQDLVEFLVEAETLDIISGFEVRSNGAASAGKWLQAKGSAEAELVFDGPDGVYNVELFYFDETDGKSQMAVFLNDQKVDQWVWDQDFGTSIASSSALTSRRLSDLVVRNGDVLRLVGQGDGGEPLRTDYLVFDQKDALSEDVVYADVEPFMVEAESLKLQGSYHVKSNGAAQGGRYIQTNNKESGAAFYQYQGDLTQMNLTLNFYDENDGVSSYKVLVDGEQVLAFSTNKNLGSALANQQTLDSKTVEGIVLKDGSQIEIQCQAGGSEPCRLDWIELH